MTASAAQAPIIWLPVVLDQRRRETGLEIDVLIPPDLFYFRGHFPGFPILPGIVQLHWAITYGRSLLPSKALVPGTIQVKFRDVVRPGEHLQLTLAYNRSDRKLIFDWRSNTGPRSSGSIVFDE